MCGRLASVEAEPCARAASNPPFTASVMRMSRTLSENRDAPFLLKPNSVAPVLSNRMPPNATRRLGRDRAGLSACKQQVARDEEACQMKHDAIAGVELRDVAAGLWVWRVEHPAWKPNQGWEPVVTST